MATVEQAFHNVRYGRMNARRLEHLAGLDLPIDDKDVLEVGAGVGDLTPFFLDRGCRVTSIEPRAENVAFFETRYAEAGFWPEGALRIQHGDVYRLAPHSTVRPHAIVFCFGLLYHLGEPSTALREMAGSCTELLILETCVSYAADDRVDYLAEDETEPSNSISGRACQPSRRWVYNRLAALFEHVYMPLTQPVHEHFRLNWKLREPPAGRHRAIFIAARQPLTSSVLVRGVPDLQYRDLPRLGAMIGPSTVSIVAPQTIFGPMSCFPDDVITEQLVRYGAHTRNELAALLRFVDDGDCVYDIGAHIGTFTVPFCAAVGKRGRVVAVEAHRDHHDKLVQNLASHGFRKSPAVRAVVGQPRASLVMHSVEANSGANYFAPAPSPAALTTDASRGLDELHAEYGEGRRVDVLKIDVEGMEVAVLRSGSSLLAKDRPILYVEVVGDQLARHAATPLDIEEILRPLGYAFFRNVGERNSANDAFSLQRLPTLADGGAFFDLLAIPEDHPRLTRAAR